MASGKWIGAAIGAIVGSAVGGIVTIATGGLAAPLVFGAASAVAGAATATGAVTGAATGAAIGATTGTVVGSATGAAVGASTGAVAGTTAGASVGYVSGNLVEKGKLPEPHFGPFDRPIKSFVDNVCRSKVLPILGSIVYCDLTPFPFIGPKVEHTGIYVGNDRIVHLDGDGHIRKVSPNEFLERLGGFNCAMTIYVSSHNGSAVGSIRASQRALAAVGKARNYNFILDNCHQFTCGCITGNFESARKFFWTVDDTAVSHLSCNEWRAWDI